MHVVGIWTILRFADPILIGTALFCLLRQKLAGRYPSFTAFLIFRLVSVPLLYVLLAQPPARYKFYFVAFWISAAIEAGLTLWCVGQMFSIALSPLRGIRKLAASTFGCMCAISLIVAAAMSLSSSLNGPRFLIELVSQMVRFESLLVLCLLVFLAFASHMLGLSYRSRIFGISLGFGITASASLFSSALMSRTMMNSKVEMIVACVSSLPLVVWNLAITLPEPARRLITVPVDSWMLRWNEIAKSFGHGPAAVVVGEDPLQMMHPNEVLMHQHVMSRKAPAGAIAQVSRS
jgi:hypothetical protein